eukprot:COSAG02_NODE_33978_length_491_cov_1.007653_1_plen_48_part_00
MSIYIYTHEMGYSVIHVMHIVAHTNLGYPEVIHGYSRRYDILCAETR